MTEFEAAGNNKEYKIEAIWYSSIYGNKAKSHLSSLYYLGAWKRYIKEENTWELSSIVQYLKKLINSFHKKHLEKPIVTFLFINSFLLIARPTVKTAKLTTTLNGKRGQPTNSASKEIKN